MQTRKSKKRKSAGSQRKLDSKPDLALITAEFQKVVSMFAGHRDVKFGKMFGSSSVLNVDGKIFAMCRKGDLVVKVPKDRVDQLVAARKGTRFEPADGRIMKEWIVIPAKAIQAKKEDWQKLSQEAYSFVKQKED
jgi:TfoX/Sxy family transcriptional regulator of competence genes